MPIAERTRARPALRIETPALTRHMIVFFPARDLKDGADDPLSDKTTKEFILEYVDFLLEVAQSTGSLDRQQGSEMRDHALKALDQHANFGISCGLFLGMTLRVLIVLYAEHFTITYILDSNNPDNVGPFQSDSTETVTEIGAYFIAELEAYSNQNQHSAPPRYRFTNNTSGYTKDIEYLNDILYREVWVALDIYLNNFFYVSRMGQQTVKGDIRGLLLTAFPADPVPDEDVVAALQRTYPGPEPSPAALAEKPRISQYLQTQSPFFAATLGIGSSLHFIAGDQPPMRWDTNHVLCYVNDKTAIYGASLVYRGRKSAESLTPDEVHSKDYDYNRYFLIYDGANAYTLGRLVRRMHVLSELRIMALIERHHVASMHNVLRLIGRDLSEIIDRMTGHYVLGADGHVKRHETLDIGRLNNILDTYNDLGKSITAAKREGHCQFGDEPMSYNRCYGGLSYRISRSKYYYDSFLQRINDLRSVDLKGAQSYDRFVLRNYSQQMQSIISIGERNALLGLRIDRAITIAHSLQQRKFAQYAAKFALFLCAIPGISAINAITGYLGGTVLEQYFPPVRFILFIIMAVVLIVLIFDFHLWFDNVLKAKGLFVDIENTVATKNSIDYKGTRILGPLRRAASAAVARAKILATKANEIIKSNWPGG